MPPRPSPLPLENKDLMTLYCNNKAAINIAHYPVQHDQTKHIEIYKHFIKKNYMQD